MNKFFNAYFPLYILSGELSLPFFIWFSNWIVYLIRLFIIIEFWEYFMYFKYYSIVEYMTCNFFSHSVTCLFIPLMVFFTEQLYIIFMKLNSSILSFFMKHASFCVMSKNTLAPQRFSPIFFSQNLFYFKFYFMVHVGLFLYKMRFFCFLGVFLPINVQLLCNYVLKRLSVLHWITFTLVLKIRWTYICVYF